MDRLTWDADARPGPVRGRGRALAALQVVAAVGVGVAAAKGGVLPAAGSAALALGVPALFVAFERPVLLIYLLVVSGFCASGAARYVPLPLGLSTDGLLLLLLAVLLVRQRTRGWRDLGHPVNLAVFGWLIYNGFELLNPAAVSGMAWLYAMRGAAAYLALTPLAVQVLDTPAQIVRLLRLWLALATLGALWGIKQLTFGLDAWESRWLQEPGNLSTHVLHGNLRVFSFLSDSGQFGVVMACSAFIAALFALQSEGLRTRSVYAAMAAVLFYGMMISGTRSAFLVIPVAVVSFVVANRNLRLGLPMFLGGAALFGLLAFTHVGQGNYHVARMRGALSPTEDASFQVRLANQKRLLPFLASHPFGGGVGSAGSWGQRFSPGTFLADLALDSYYVKIAAEQGPVGLAGFLAMMVGGSITGLRARGRVRDPELRRVVEGMWAAYNGVLVVSYSNQYLGQMPTGVFMYVTLAVFVRAPALPPAEDPAAGRMRA